MYQDTELVNGEGVVYLDMKVGQDVQDDLPDLQLKNATLPAVTVWSLGCSVIIGMTE